MHDDLPCLTVMADTVLHANIIHTLSHKKRLFLQTFLFRICEFCSFSDKSQKLQILKILRDIKLKTAKFFSLLSDANACMPQGVKQGKSSDLNNKVLAFLVCAEK